MNNLFSFQLNIDNVRLFSEDRQYRELPTTLKV